MHWCEGTRASGVLSPDEHWGPCPPSLPQPEQKGTRDGVWNELCWRQRGPEASSPQSVDDSQAQHHRGFPRSEDIHSHTGGMGVGVRWAGPGKHMRMGPDRCPPSVPCLSPNGPFQKGKGRRLRMQDVNTSLLPPPTLCLPSPIRLFIVFIK